MGAITLETAKEHLNGWLEAEKAVMTHQAYKIGSRELTRADLDDIQKSIKYWENKVNTLENLAKYGGRGRVYRVMPRDL